MYFAKRNILICTLLLCLVMPAFGASMFDKIRSLFSVNVPKNILESVNLEIKGSIKAKDIVFFLPNRLELTEVEVLDKTGARMLYSPSVKLTVSLPSLLTSNYVITDALVESIFFRYTVKGDVHNVIEAFEPKIPKKDQEPSKTRVTIVNVKVKNGHFEMEHDANVTIAANGITANGTFWVEDGPFNIDIARAHVKSGVIAVDDLDLPLSNLEAVNLKISDQLVFTPHLTATYEKAKISGSGTVFVEQERYDIKAHIDAPANTYPQGLKPLPFIPPAFSADVVILGHLEDPNIQTNARLGAFDFLGVQVAGGTAQARINKDAVVLESSRIDILPSGKLLANGKIDLNSGAYEFSSHNQNVSAQAIADLATLDETVLGVIDGRAQITGNVLKNENVFNITVAGVIKKGAIREVTLADVSDIDVDLSYTIDELIRIKRATVSDNLGLKFSIKGEGDLRTKILGFSYDVKGRSLSPYINRPELKLAAKTISSTGTIYGPKDHLELGGNIEIGKLNYDRYQMDNIKAVYHLKDNRLKLSNLSSLILGGELVGNVEIKDVLRPNNYSGALTLTNIDLPRLSRVFEIDTLAGKANADITLEDHEGKSSHPFLVNLDNFTVADINIDRVEIAGVIQDDHIAINSLRTNGMVGALSGRDLVFIPSSKKIIGEVFLENIAIEGVLVKYFPGLVGKVRGPVALAGSFPELNLSAHLEAKEIKLFGQPLGDGPLDVNLGRDTFGKNAQVEDLVLKIAAGLKNAQSMQQILFSWALNKDLVNVEARLFGLSFDTRMLPNAPPYVGIKGKLDGEIIASGLLSNLDMTAVLRSSSYAFVDPQAAKGSQEPEIHGPLLVDLKLKNGRLHAVGCASLLKSSAVAECMRESAISFNINGPFSQESFALKTVVEINHQHLEDALMPLGSEFSRVDGILRFFGEVVKEKNRATLISGNLNVDRLLLGLPNIPHVELEYPITLNINPGEYVLEQPAGFMFAPGRLQVSGGIYKNHLDFAMQGAIPLIITRFLVPQIKRASGLASGELTITSEVAKPLLSGWIEPETGSEIIFKKYIEPMEVKKGVISFEPISDQGFATAFDNIELGVGDGRLALDGVIQHHYSSGEKPASTTFDLRLDGSGLVLRDDGDFVEADFKINTVKEQNTALTKGRIEITDGRLSRKFDLRNFVAQIESTPKTDEFKFFENVDADIDIDVAIRQFNAAARMLNIDVDTMLSGQITGLGKISHPKFIGNINVDEGYIRFPATTIEMSESRVELDENSNLAFDPKFSITGVKELEKDVFGGSLSQDTTIELALKGDKDRLSLELRPISGDLRLTQTKIFLLLLLPQGALADEGLNQVDTIKQGAKRAAMALSGEVFLRPLTNELQDLLESKTNTRIQFGSSLAPTGVTLKLNWKMGPRIEFQGSYMFIGDESRALDQGESQIAFDSLYPLGDIKVKLLLFDHSPFGPLFFESAFGASWQRDTDVSQPFGSLRLKYRAVAK